MASRILLISKNPKVNPFVTASAIQGGGQTSAVKDGVKGVTLPVRCRC